MPQGLTDLKAAKAPFLNLINALPFVVPPSGCTIKGVASSLSASSYLSAIASNIAERASLLPLWIKRDPHEAAINPTKGIYSTDAFAMKEVGNFDIRVRVSIQH